MFCRILVFVLLLAAPLTARASALSEELDRLYAAEKYEELVARTEALRRGDEIAEAVEWMMLEISRGAPHAIILRQAELLWFFADATKSEPWREMSAAYFLYAGIALSVDGAKCADQAEVATQLKELHEMNPPPIRNMCAKPGIRRALLRDIAQKFDFFLRDERRMDPAICAQLDAPASARVRRAAAVAAIPDLLDSLLPLRRDC